LGSSLGNASTSCVFRANGFWEKPSPNIARELHRNGCLLNTFVMCARAGVFLELLRLAAPDVMRAFASLSVPPSREMKTLGRIYWTLPTGDFSRQVLAACTDRLLVVRLEDAGWSDLGTEERVHAVMAREGAAGAEPHNLEAFHAWLSAYRKRLDEICDRPASASASSRS
jgi:mannose-1-phosphate guanylyltransferase